MNRRISELSWRPTRGFVEDDEDGSDGYDDGDDDAGHHYLGSFSSHPNGSKRPLGGAHLRCWGSVDHLDSGKFAGERAGEFEDGALVSAIDRKMKEHTDVLLHSVECLSARVSQMESRTRQLEDAMDDLKVAIEFNHGRMDRKLKEMETVLMQVQGGIKDVRDKQEIAEAKLRLSKLDVFRADTKSGNEASHESSSNSDTSSSASLQSHQPSTVKVPSPQQPFTSSSSIMNAFPQNYPSSSIPALPPFPTSVAPMVMATAPQLPSQLQQSMLPSILQQGSHYQLSVSSPAIANPQPYNASSSRQLQPTPHLHQPYPHLPPSLQFIQLPSTNPPFSRTSPQVQYLSSRAPEEVHYPRPHSTQKSLHLHDWSPLSGQRSISYMEQTSIQQYPTSQTQWLQHQGHTRAVDSFQYSDSSIQGSGPTMKPGDEGTSSKLPIGSVLPYGIPTATSVDSESSSSGAGNRVLVDNVVDKVVSMGFRRDLVKATINKLTESGQSVDLNLVLDKLMNNG